MSTNYYVTTPIYYVNDIPHIGHAYTSLAADVLARFMRLDGKNVKFLTGTDEHGQKVEKSAEKKGIAPQQFTDQVSEQFRNLNIAMNFSNDDFIRTTEDRHKRAVQALWLKLQDNGHIYLGKYAGWYSVRDEAFYNESELVVGKAPTGAEVEWVEEPSYFFDLSKWQEQLLAYYQQNPDFIQPASRRNEVINFVKSGLTDLSVSRVSISWGIPVPNDPKHTIYVWLDALTNYISALGYPDHTAPDFTDFWPADLHLVGKDIIRFHAVYWPAFLLAAGLPLPKAVFAHGWWTNEGQKISKSVGNVINPLDLTAEFGLDQTRYFLLRETSFGSDANFSRISMINRINSELANNIGNLIQRTLSMVSKNSECRLANNTTLERLNELQGGVELLVKLEHYYQTYHAKLQALEFNLALEQIVLIGNDANCYIDLQAPWKLKTTDPQKMEEVLYTLVEAIRYIGIMLQPFTPDSAAKILDLLQIDATKRNYSDLNQISVFKPGHLILNPQVIFPKYIQE